MFARPEPKIVLSFIKIGETISYVSSSKIRTFSIKINHFWNCIFNAPRQPHIIKYYAYFPTNSTFDIGISCTSHGIVADFNLYFLFLQKYKRRLQITHSQSNSSYRIQLFNSGLQYLRLHTNYFKINEKSQIPKIFSFQFLFFGILMLNADYYIYFIFLWVFL